MVYAKAQYCKGCGCVIADAEAHGIWHDQIDEALGKPTGVASAIEDEVPRRDVSGSE